MYAQEEIDALRPYCESIATASEQGVPYLLLRGLKLPQGAQPEKINALLSPGPRDNYDSRLFFEQKPACPYQRNWNGQVRVLDTNWFAFSWKFPAAGLKLVEILLGHLEGLTRAG